MLRSAVAIVHYEGTMLTTSVKGNGSQTLVSKSLRWLVKTPMYGISPLSFGIRRSVVRSKNLLFLKFPSNGDAAGLGTTL